MLDARTGEPGYGQKDHTDCVWGVAFIPDGRRLVSNTIYDLKGGKIVRQFDVQVMDPEG